MGMWWCTHVSNTGERMTILHEGRQCESIDHQEHDCFLWKSGWDFISCRSAEGYLIALDHDEVRAVDPETLKVTKGRREHR